LAVSFAGGFCEKAAAACRTIKTAGSKFVSVT